jgi:hypothetical protein
VCGAVGLLAAALVKWPTRGPIEILARGLGTAAFTFLLLSELPIAYQFFGPQRVLRAIRSPGFFVTDLLNFVIPTEAQLLAPASAIAITHRFSGNASEWNGYIGIPLLALLVFIVIVWRREPVVRWATLVAVTMAVLSMGPRLHVAGTVTQLRLPWVLVQRLPVLDDILPSRLMLYFFLIAGLLLTFFATRLPAGRLRLAGAAAIIVALLPLLPRAPFPAPDNPVPAFFSSSEVQRIPEGSVALVAPFSGDPGLTATNAANAEATYAMLWQVRAGMRFRMPEGYVRVPSPTGEANNGPLPSPTQTVMVRIQEGGKAPEQTPDLRAGIAADFARWRVRTVIVGPMDNQTEMLAFFTELLGRQPEAHGDVYVWWNVQGPARLESQPAG